MTLSTFFWILPDSVNVLYKVVQSFHHGLRNPVKAWRSGLPRGHQGVTKGSPRGLPRGYQGVTKGLPRGYQGVTKWHDWGAVISDCWRYLRKSRMFSSFSRVFKKSDNSSDLKEHEHSFGLTSWTSCPIPLPRPHSNRTHCYHYPLANYERVNYCNRWR